jgi:hypothetical protein
MPAPPPTAESPNLRRIEIDPPTALIALALLIGAAVAIVVGGGRLFGPVAFESWDGMTKLAAAVLSTLLLLPSTLAKKGAGRVTVGDRALVIEHTGSRIELPFSDLADAWLWPDGKTVCFLTTRGDRLEAEIPDTKAQRALLDAAVTTGARERPFRLFEPRSPSIRLGIAMIPFMIASVPLGALAVAPFILAMQAVSRVAPFILQRGHRHARVGRDGLALTGGRRARFIPWSTVTDVTRDGALVTVHTSDGRGTTLLTSPFARARYPLSERRAAELVTLVSGALAAYRAAPTEPASAASLDRAGRPLSAWRAALKGLSGEGDYRTLPLGTADLAAIVENPRAPLERRLAAALALSGTADHDAAARVRVAVDTTASPRARVALERAAQDALDEEAYREAAAEEEARERFKA